MKGQWIKVFVCVLAAGWPGLSAVHCLRPEGAADKAMSVLRGLREPSLLLGNHIQCSGKMLVPFLPFFCPVLYFTCFFSINFVCPLCCLYVVQNVPPDLAISAFILEQSLSVRALQEMLANRVEMTEVGLKNRNKEMNNRKRNIWKGDEMWEIE